MVLTKLLAFWTVTKAINDECRQFDEEYGRPEREAEGEEAEVVEIKPREPS